MEPKIGDFVVRKWQGGFHWSMTGIIASIEHIGNATFYTIRWNEEEVCPQRWQASEFEVIA